MVSIDVRYEGELRCAATHGPSGRELHTDAPVDNHGKGESFSPTDLVATALGACMLTIMGISAERHGIRLSGARAQVEKRMVSEPKRRIGGLEVVLALPGGLEEKHQRMLERAALACPVHASLHPEVEIPVRFDWGGAES